MSGFFRGSQPRPKICPSCGNLVGAVATRCPNCGANVNFSLAAVSRSLGRLMPTTSPATYGILTVSCVIFAASFLATFEKTGGIGTVGGGLGGLFNFGAIDGNVLVRLGASMPWYINIQEPWRFVTAVFLHASVLHILFNMWVLMDIGPQIEELYGSARFLFVYVVSGIGGYVLSSFFGHFSVGGSGAILGLCGVVLAVTIGTRNTQAKMFALLRGAATDLRSDSHVSSLRRTQHRHVGAYRRPCDGISARPIDGGSRTSVARRAQTSLRDGMGRGASGGGELCDGGTDGKIARGNSAARYFAAGDAGVSCSRRATTML